VVFMALSADSHPHFTTIANFITQMEREIVELFCNVLLYCAASIKKIKEFLAGGKKKIGPSGNEQKTNITDPDSAKMTTSHGVLQGYNGLAVVDDKHQIVVCAEAHGSGQEAHLLMPMVQSTRKNFRTIGRKTDIFKKTKLTADSGFHSGKSMEEIEGSKVDAYIADPQYRKREEAFANQGRYKERHNEEDRLASRKKRKDERKQFGLEDFLYDAKRHTCICPAGKSLYRTGRDMVISGYRVARYKAPLSACRPCPLRAKCLRHPENLDAQRQVQFVKQRLAKGMRTTPPPSGCRASLIVERGERSTASGWPRRSRCSATRTTRAWITSRCVARGRWMRSGSYSTSCSTSRRSRTTGRRHEGYTRSDRRTLPPALNRHRYLQAVPVTPRATDRPAGVGPLESHPGQEYARARWFFYKLVRRHG